MSELLDLYFDGLDADGELTLRTRHDYREKADLYARPHLGPLKVQDVRPETILGWQRKLLAEPRGKCQRPLSPNTVRLARAALAGAFKLAAASGIVATNPLLGAPRPTPRRSIPRHWSPEEARTFLAMTEGDRTWPLWTFLMGAGLRVSELVALRWPNVNLDEGLVRVVDFAIVIGSEVVAGTGKSRDAVRTVDLDEGLVRVLRQQRAQQAAERLASSAYRETDHVFTKPAGGPTTRSSSRSCWCA